MNGKNLNHSKIMVVFALFIEGRFFLYIQPNIKIKEKIKMKENELNYYEKIGNWDFSQIKCKTENLTNWDFYEKIRDFAKHFLRRSRFYGMIKL